MSSKRIRRLIGDFLLHAVLIGVAIYMILPFIWMVSTSVKPQDEIFSHPPILISPRSSLYAYKDLILNRNILNIVQNTFIIAAFATALQLFFCSLGGYAFAKYKFPGRETMFAVLLATLVIPFSVTLVPLYIIMLRLNWIDTFLPLIVPGAANAFGIFFMRQFITTISDELIDAARIDGASEFGIFLRIILPIISPALISLGLIFFMASWNSFLFPLVVLKSPSNHTLPIAIRSMISGVIGRPVYHLQMAASVISIIPLLIIFLIFQRRFVEGITAGAIKG
ncbi:MAG: carbohydrate ABC transporter permease [Anaerolineales bacterium]|nr:carbohydrate ABC transporter permease [Anaerolineales bacterium]